VNPHDPAVRPGAHLVAAELGVGDPWELSDRHPVLSPLDIVGRLVATAAHEADDLHADLTRAAQAAIETLEPIAHGKAPQMRGSYGLLGAAGPQLELLAARRDMAYQQLARAVAGYRRLLPEAAGTAAQGLGALNWSERRKTHRAAATTGPLPAIGRFRPYARWTAAGCG
jgi:hypothetical protein